jgi:hypothetical protein
MGLSIVVLVSFSRVLVLTVFPFPAERAGEEGRGADAEAAGRPPPATRRHLPQPQPL